MSDEIAASSWTGSKKFKHSATWRVSQGIERRVYIDELGIIRLQLREIDLEQKNHLPVGSGQIILRNSNQFVKLRP